MAEEERCPKHQRAERDRSQQAVLLQAMLHITSPALLDQQNLMDRREGGVCKRDFGDALQCTRSEILDELRGPSLVDEAGWPTQAVSVVTS